MDTPLKRVRPIILLHAVHDCPGGSTSAIARHVSFGQIVCNNFWRATSRRIFMQMTLVLATCRYITLRSAEVVVWPFTTMNIYMYT